VTLRLRLGHQDRSWPELFKAARVYRKLRVLVDADLLNQNPDEWTIENLLAGFLSHKDVEHWKYRDEGPPPGTRQVSSPAGFRGTAGWAVAAAAPPGSFATHSVSYATNESVGRTWISDESVLAASLDNRSGAYEQHGSAQAAARRSADALAACVAQQLKVDLFVTSRPYLHAVSWALGRGVTYCHPAGALALVSLYLRGQGEYLVWKDPDSASSASFNKGLFYWVGARELLPAGWRWFSACVNHSYSTGAVRGSSELVGLGGAVFQRVTRVLQARDDLLRAVNRRQDNDVAEDALIALDACLIFLMGAIDATARVAHRVLDLPLTRIHLAKWQNPAWLANVAARAPDLAAIVAEETAGADALTIVRLLRNTVHDAGLTALAVGLPPRREATLASLPDADKDRILASADRNGGIEEWGLQELIPGRLHADPATLLERLLPATIKLLNDLMNATPVEDLPGASLTPDKLGPPHERNSPFGERERLSIRWQLGL
jgi:hypothetical protein